MRETRGPAFVHATCTRPYSHSLSDDHAFYRPKRELADETGRDPVVRLRARLVDERIASADEIAAIEREVDEEVQRAARGSDDVAGARPRERNALTSTPDRWIRRAARSTPSRRPARTPRFRWSSCINRCLKDEMARDPRIVVFGEDVADASRSEVLDECSGQGRRLQGDARAPEDLRPERVFNSPLAEANIVGRAIGMATRGLKPVVEIQFFDYIWPAMMQIRNELSMMRWRSNGEFACPVVIRVPIGGYLQGGAIYHSQSGEVIFTHCPGLRVVMPSTALDANGLLRTAIRCDDPVLFLEHKHLYRQPYAKGAIPAPTT